MPRRPARWSLKCHAIAYQNKFRSNSQPLTPNFQPPPITAFIWSFAILLSNQKRQYFGTFFVYAGLDSPLCHACSRFCNHFLMIRCMIYGMLVLIVCLFPYRKPYFFARSNFLRSGTKRGSQRSKDCEKGPQKILRNWVSPLKMYSPFPLSFWTKNYKRLPRRDIEQKSNRERRRVTKFKNVPFPTDRMWV